MKKLAVFALTALACLSLTACDDDKNHDYDLFVSHDSEWRTFVAGDDFDPTGLVVTAKCKDCDKEKTVRYKLENYQNLTTDQTSVKIKYKQYEIDYPITVKKKYRIACVGDSLTAGHNWASESYPSYLKKDVTKKYEVGNYGINGISITGYGGSWDNPNMRYIKQDVYKNVVKFAPDIFAIMLGTNDATGWENAQANFVSEYKVLLDSFVEKFPHAKFIMMVSPPTKDGNQFGIPNTTIKEQVNPVQRQLAEEYHFSVIDLRNEFEATDNYESKYLRPNNDGVHFTVSAAKYVASRVWEVAKDLRF